jgi:flagellin-like hook-associated protein FlgL
LVEGSSFNGLRLLDGSSQAVRLQAGGSGINGSIQAELLRRLVSTFQQTSGTGTYTNYDRTFGQQTTGANSIAPRFLVGDFNQDGIDDVVALKVTNQFGSFVLDAGIFGGESGTTTFSIDDSSSASLLISSPVMFSFMWARLRDIDSDGDMDIEVTFGYTDTFDTDYQSNVQLINNSTAGGAINFADFSAGTGAADQSVATATGDFNNDGVDDQVTANGLNLRFRIQDTTTSQATAMVTESLLQETFSLLTESAAKSALETLRTNLEQIAQARGRLGSSMSRVSAAEKVLSETRDRYREAASRISDVDVAAETVAAVRFSILQNVGAAILAQANTQPGLARSLLGR